MLSLEEALKLYFKRDRIAELFDIETLECANGRARTRMVIQDKHLNGLDIVHGASIFGLCDFTFALASNSHGTAAVAINTACSFVKGVRSGTLHAEARESSLSPKLGTYEIVVTDDAGDTVALFHGMVYRKKERIIDIVEARQAGA